VTRNKQHLILFGNHSFIIYLIRTNKHGVRFGRSTLSSQLKIVAQLQLVKLHEVIFLLLLSSHLLLASQHKMAAEHLNPGPSILQSLTFKLPGTFSFSPADWPAYKRTATRWFTLSEAKIPAASRLSDLKKREALIYLMGDEQADQIVATFQSSLDPNGTITAFDAFLTLLDNYFTPRTNIVAQRAQFLDRRQKDVESNEEFIRAMFALVDKCDYCDLKDEQLRDKLCHGMRDRKLAAKLRSNEQLTLEDVLKRMRSKDAILKDLHEEQERVRDTEKLVRSEIKSGSLDAISKFQRPQPPASRRPSPKQEQPHASATTSGNPPVITHIKSCKFCGTSHRYGKAYCPSKDAVCRPCKVVGHYAKFCQKPLKSLTYQDDSDPEQF
jgi:hypothetical protein